MYPRLLASFARLLFGRPQVMHGGAVARAFPERVVEAKWSVVLLEKLGEGLVGPTPEMFSSDPARAV
jgi:hypothetical protein